MALIESFYVPQDELGKVGLTEVNMKRLGRFVALAGKNGAGKSRLLTTLKACVVKRSYFLKRLDEIEQEIASLEIVLNEHPIHSDRNVLNSINDFYTIIKV